MRSERGSAMVVMLIVLVGLGTIAGLTVISVQSGSATSNNQAFTSIALYAAESGAAAAIDALRKNVRNSPPPYVPSSWIDAFNADPPVRNEIPGNDRVSGDAQNLLSPDRKSWYTVKILNNPSDSGFAAGNDNDGIVIIHSTGHGPNGAVAELQWEVQVGANPNDPVTILSWHQSL